MRGRFTSGKSQGFLLLLVGLLVSIFIGTFASSATVGAQATWGNSQLEYNGQTYSPINDQSTLQNLGLEDETRVYGVLVESSTPPEFRVISFPTDVDMQTAASARHIVFEYTPPNTYDQTSTQIITTEPAGENSGGLEQGTSCTISGIGWFVCPISNFLASGMDWLYGVLTQFLTSQPLNVSDRTSGLYIAWNIMRGIANAVFIVSFIIIIYSHISNMGVSNYGIKKMLPRLVVAAVLVNISYYICAIAIDLSNIIGQSIQDMFISIRNTITTVGNASEAIPTWEQVTTYVLSAGTVGAAAGVFFFTHSGSVGSAAIMLLPLLLGLLVTVMVVLLVLAARQALIVILTIISPLAFVAYLLPGTEKWFDKWKDLFLTMLIFFPAFSAVFGGSQLAGAAIIQNASSVVMLILGLGVQIAPLAIAPLILKLSGGLLNRFAGVVNNPAKGLIDRTRNLAKEQSQHLANKARSKDNSKWWNRWNPSHRIGQRANQYQTNRKKRIENYQNMADLAAKDSKEYRKHDRTGREIEHNKQIFDKELDIAWNDYSKSNSGMMHKDIKLRILADKSELGKLELDNRYAEVKTGHNPTGYIGPLREDDPTGILIRDTQTTAQHLAAQSLRKSYASRALNQQTAEEMLQSQELQGIAAGVYGDLAKSSAIASATSTMRTEYNKSVADSTELMKHFKLDSSERQALVRGNSVSKTEGGVTFEFKPQDMYAVEAAIAEQMAVGTVRDIKEIISLSGSALAEYRGSISSALASSGVKNKAPFLGGKLIDEVYKGDIRSEADLERYVADWVKAGKFKPADVSIADKDAMELLTTATTNARAYIGDERLEGLAQKIDAVFTNENLIVNVADNAIVPFRDLRRSLPGPPPPPNTPL